MTHPDDLDAFSTNLLEVCSIRAICETYGISRQAVSLWATSGRALCFRLSNRNVFPLFQFDRGGVRRDVQHIARRLTGVADALTIALWFTTPLSSDPRQRTPVELLDDSADDIAAHAADEAAWRWTR